MKLKVNDEEVYSLTEIQKKVIQHDINQSIFDEDIKRRVRYIVEHKYERCFQRLCDEWLPKLRDRMDAVPTDKDALADVIFSQPDYKDKEQRDKEFEEEKMRRLKEVSQ